MLRRGSRLGRLTRLHAASAAAFIYPLGPVIATSGRAKPLLLLLVSIVGVLSHTYGCTVNDLADLESDRRNPARASSVLVHGDLTVEAARAAALAQLAAAFALALLMAALAGGRWLFAATTALLFLSITLSNLFQKRRLTHPLGMDALFGINMGIPAALSCLLFTDIDTRPALLAGGVFALHMVLLNLVAGNLKDLDHDRLVGDDTTALRFGVQLTSDRCAVVPAQYRTLVAMLVAGSAVGLEALVLLAPAAIVTQAVLCVGVAAAHVAAWGSLARLLRGRRPVLANGREPYLLLNFGALIVACMPWAPAPVIVIAAATVGWLPVVTSLALRPSVVHAGGANGTGD